MVQLQPPQVSDAVAPSESIVDDDVRHDVSPTADSPHAFTALQLALNPSASIYHGYETYIDDGLICLRHKIRNIEKKKLKLEGYKLRLKNGETLNQDQVDAVGRYEEVVHNLKFAKELQNTLCTLTQDLLRAQRKAVQHEQALRAATERKRLSMVMQMQHVLHSLQRLDVRKNFCNLREYAHYLSTQDVENLLDLASLVGCSRDESMSLEDQMDRAAFVYLDLLDGNDKSVAGSTNKRLKEKLLRLVNCGFFDHVPAPQSETKVDTDYQKPNASSRSNTISVVRLECNDLASRQANLSGQGQEKGDNMPSSNWKAEFLALKAREPPDSWDMEFSENPMSMDSGLQKPWKGAAGVLPQTTLSVKKSSAEPKQKRQRKSKEKQGSKSDVEMAEPVEVFNSPSSLAKDPALRRQQLDHLMDQIKGSFSFMQDSLLDAEGSPTNGRNRGLHLSPGSSPLVQREQKNTADILAETQHSTPLHPHLLPANSKSNLDNGDQTPDTSELKLHTDDTPQGKQNKDFNSPPLYSRESVISLHLENKNSKQALCNGEGPPSIPAQAFSTPPNRHSLPATSSASFSSVHSVFSGEVPVTRNSELKADSGFLESVSVGYITASTQSYSTASTQTPPELSLPQDDLQMESAYLSESDVSATSQVYSSPGQRSGPQSALVQHYYPRSTIRGMAQGSRGFSTLCSPGTSRGGYEMHRVNLRAPGGGFIAQTQREPGSVLCTSQENGYQLSHKRTGGAAARRNSSVAGWSDSSQVSSPDREAAYLVDSAHSDPVSVPPSHTLLPVYPHLRVAFSAARATNLAPGTLDQPIAFDLLLSNLGGAFDASSGHFSCPAAGTYVFFFHILKLAISVPLYINLMRNDEVVASAYANDGAPDHETASNHAVLPLHPGDHVWLRLHRGAIYGSSWKYSTFSGFLLYLD